MSPSPLTDSLVDTASRHEATDAEHEQPQSVEIGSDIAVGAHVPYKAEAHAQPHKSPYEARQHECERLAAVKGVSPYQAFQIFSYLHSHLYCLFLYCPHRTHHNPQLQVFSGGNMYASVTAL